MDRGRFLVARSRAPGKRDFVAILVAGIAAAVGLLILLAIYVYVAPCQDITPVFDSRAVESSELREVWTGVRETYAASVGRGPVWARPVKVDSVSGRWVTIEVTGPKNALINPAYGEVWQNVYARHHNGGPRTCVFLHY